MGGFAQGHEAALGAHDEDGGEPSPRDLTSNFRCYNIYYNTALTFVPSLSSSRRLHRPIHRPVVRPRHSPPPHLLSPSHRPVALVVLVVLPSSRRPRRLVVPSPPPSSSVAPVLLSSLPIRCPSPRCHLCRATLRHATPRYGAFMNAPSSHHLTAPPPHRPATPPPHRSTSRRRYAEP